MIITIEPLNRRHYRIYSRLRQEDLDEMRGMYGGVDPRATVKMNIEVSREGWAVFADGRCEVICGALPYAAAPRVGMPWMLATDVIEARPVTFYRVSVGLVDMIKDRYDALFQYISEDNKLSARWLSWCGFSKCRDIEWANGSPVRAFYWIKEDGDHVQPDCDSWAIRSRLGLAGI